MTSGTGLILTAIIDNRFVYASTEHEIAEVIRTVIDVPHPVWTSQLYLWDRPCRSMLHHRIDDEEFPEHQLRVSTNPETGWGALNYYGDEDVWDSLNPNPSADAPELWFDPTSGARFRRNAALPLADVREAVREFTKTGSRPTRVTWQVAERV
ncbi:Imm1 family immunity protein [Allokutzneria sp. NRRL B-24872]|uniref:Imm1 family immunity protein n=1 Tax=Allokutzneria sp. NRRL B-24872 TaxID=1137961 RepID=UPI000A3724A4|nr:Imm1 family immunity protein [Allokutzneria sp. NRRL B-24872]